MRRAALMLVGPGEADRHLARCLAAADGWADAVLVYADGVDAATRRCIEWEADAWRLGDENLFMASEADARNALFELADEQLDDGDIVCVLDADEMFQAPAVQVRAALGALSEDTSADSWNIHFKHIWNEEGTLHRVDGQWQPSVGPRIYRHRPGFRVHAYGNGWVCPPLPMHLMFAGSEPVLEVLHWSYARERDRAPKVERYTQRAGHAIPHVMSILDENPTLEPV